MVRSFLFCYLSTEWKYRRYESVYLKFLLLEILLDLQAFDVKAKAKAWFRGLQVRGLTGAHDAAAGLLVT